MASSRKAGAKARYAGIGSDAVERATGRTWDMWLETLAREGAQAMTHKEIASMLQQEFRLASWWAQMVTVGYEQATGMRAANQTARGFRAHASRTIAAEAGRAFAACRDEDMRAQWLAEAPLELRASAPDAPLRVAWTTGSSRVEMRIQPKGAAKSQVVVEEEGLPDAAALKRRKLFWREAIDRLQALLEE